MQWAYQNSEPSNLLQDVSTRAVVHYLVGEDMDRLLSQGRLEAAQNLESRIQDAANERGLGVKIVFVGLQDIHPPTPVAANYENVISAEQTRLATNLLAHAAAIQTNEASIAMATVTTNTAMATSFQLETDAYARAARFTNQIPAFEAAPSVYEQYKYFQTFADATKNSRKYILLVTNSQNVLIFDLEDKIRADLLNVNPE
jgi:regulator of protease activity HflC (stomatin/prohibitin superfamily)